MKISTLPAKGGGTRYLVMNDNEEIICSFAGLTQAALVMRYLQGCDMPPDDCSLAVAAMQIHDSDNKARRADRDAKRAERREKAQAAQQPAEAPETPVKASSERKEPEENGNLKG